MEALIDRLRAALAEAGLERAVLSHPETLAHLCLFDPSVEEWPVANPFVASPALLVLDADDATLLVASFHAAHAARSPVPVEQYRSYDYERQPAPEVELEAALRGLAGGPGQIGVEAASLPGRGRRRAPGGGRASSWRSTSSSCARGASSSRSSSKRSGAPRGSPMSCRAPSRSSSSPARREAEVAATAQAVMASDAGRRVPAILTVTTGEATATGGWEATERVIAPGDLVLCDTSPWIDGHWSDSANAVCAGDAEQRPAAHLRPRAPGARARDQALPARGDGVRRRRGRARGARRPRPDLRSPHRPRHRRLVVRAAPHHAVRAHQARGGHGARGRAGVLRRRLRRHPPRARVRRARRAATRS